MPPTALAVFLTGIALVAFAFNSILTRLALGAGSIDAASFTTIRLVSGAVVLALITLVRSRSWRPLAGRGILAPLALFAYAAPFSFAYLRIGAAVGALVLFGVVQITMIGYGLLRGERTTGLSWVGAFLAFAGLLNLTLPAVSRPDPIGVLLMSVAGVAWGVYSLLGRSDADPVVANARNFLWSSGLAIILLLARWSSVDLHPHGVQLAILSGAVTSGIGYAVWYRAVRMLTPLQAAVAQMMVPIIAAIAARVLLAEQLSTRLILSGAIIFSGVSLVLLSRSRRSGTNVMSDDRLPSSR